MKMFRDASSSARLLPTPLTNLTEVWRSSMSGQQTTRSPGHGVDLGRVPIECPAGTNEFIPKRTSHRIPFRASSGRLGTPPESYAFGDESPATGCKRLYLAPATRPR
jgi:hypothetical protein